MKNTRKKLVAFIILMAIAITGFPSMVHAKNVMDYAGAFWDGDGPNYNKLKSRIQSNNEKIQKLQTKYKTALKKEKAAKKKGIKVYGLLQLTGDGKTYMIIPHDKYLDVDEDYGYIVNKKKASSPNYRTSMGDGYYTWRLYKGKNTHKYGGDTYKATLIRTNYGSAKYKEQIAELKAKNSEIKDAIESYDEDVVVLTTSETAFLKPGGAVGMELSSSNEYVSLGVTYDDEYFEVYDESIPGEMCILVVREDAPVNTTTRVYYGNCASNVTSYIDITIEPDNGDDYYDDYEY